MSVGKVRASGPQSSGVRASGPRGGAPALAVRMSWAAHAWIAETAALRGQSMSSLVAALVEEIVRDTQASEATSEAGAGDVTPREGGR